MRRSPYGVRVLFILERDLLESGRVQGTHKRTQTQVWLPCNIKWNTTDKTIVGKIISFWHGGKCSLLGIAYTTYVWILFRFNLPLTAWHSFRVVVFCCCWSIKKVLVHGVALKANQFRVSYTNITFTQNTTWWCLERMKNKKPNRKTQISSSPLGRARFGQETGRMTNIYSFAEYFVLFALCHPR